MIEQEANVFPMIPPGGSLSEPIEGEPAHAAGLGMTAVQAVSVLLEDRLITLTRAVGLIRRRNLPVRSLAVGPTATPGISRLTIMMQSDTATAERAVQHLQKVIGVRAAAAFPSREGVARELALVKVRAPHERYGELLDVVQLYNAAVVDDSSDGMIVELSGSEAFVLSCIRALERFERDRGGAERHHRPGHLPQPPFRDGHDDRTSAGVLRCRRRSQPARRPHLRDHRLRQPGTRPRPQPSGQRRDGGRRLASRRGSWDRARAAGLDVRPVAEAAEAADVIMMLVPDQDGRPIYEAAWPRGFEPGKTLMFAHGFNIHYGEIVPPAGVDVTMVAPKSPGHLVRSEFEAGRGVPGLVAVHQDASGEALANALAYAAGIGCTRAGVIETSFREETETDLFGEQAVLCGGVTALVKAGFETLTAAGYRPEMAYFECLHELKLIVDLMYRGGLGFMRYSISDTAEYGDYTRGPRVITDETRAEMQRILDGDPGRPLRPRVAGGERGGPAQLRAAAPGGHGPRDRAGGRQLRAMMPWSEEGKQRARRSEAGGSEDAAESRRRRTSGSRRPLTRCPLIARARCSRRSGMPM